MSERRKHIVITGANGYIGRQLATVAVSAGCQVTALTRNCPRWLAALGARHVLFDLGKPVTWSPSDSIDAVIHLAYAADVVLEHQNRATTTLLDIANTNRASFIFVSSQSAVHNAPSTYGRTKWRIEQSVLSANATVVRAGLVYGRRQPAGLFGRLLKLVARMPVLPSLVPAPCVQPIHVDDLCAALLTLAYREPRGGEIIQLAQHTPVALTHFLRVVARERLGKPRLFLPLPTRAATMVAHIGRKLRLFTNECEQILSLARLEPMQTDTDLLSIGQQLRPLEDGLHSNGRGRRRRFAREGHVLMRYVMRSRANTGLVRRYVRAIESTRTDGELQPLALPGLALAWPAILALYERRGGQDSMACVSGRIRAATKIAEASPTTIDHFVATTASSRLLTGVQILAAVALELPNILIRQLISLWCWLRGKHA